MTQNTSRRASNICTFSLGAHNGNKRFWAQKRYLSKIGLHKGTIISVDFSKNDRRITVEADEKGTRKMSGRPDGTPILDIKNKQVAETFGENVEKVTVRYFKNKIIIFVSANEQRKAERRAKTSNKAIEIFGGGGVLASLTEQAGFLMDTVIEREDKYLEVFEQNVDAVTICADIHDVDLDDIDSSCTLLSMGYPCTSYSQSNVKMIRQKKMMSDEAIEEAKDADYLILPILNIISKANPRVLLVEEVVAFLDSTPFAILSYALKKLDYKISTQIVTGSFTNRKRVAIVAIADDEPVDLSDIQYQAPRTIESHLKTPIDEREFAHIDDRPRESGARRKGLGIRSHLPSEMKINTITCHWTRHNHLSLAHPTKEDYFSDFTIAEVQSLHGLPASFNPGEIKTTAREILGQGVCCGFNDVLNRIYQRVCVKPSTKPIKAPVSTSSLVDTSQLAFGW
jgi:site-specific DNA-cytosine methylase